MGIKNFSKVFPFTGVSTLPDNLAIDAYAFIFRMMAPNIPEKDKLNNIIRFIDKRSLSNDIWVWDNPVKSSNSIKKSETDKRVAIRNDTKEKKTKAIAKAIAKIKTPIVISHTTSETTSETTDVATTNETSHVTSEPAETTYSPDEHEVISLTYEECIEMLEDDKLVETIDAKAVSDFKKVINADNSFQLFARKKNSIMKYINSLGIRQITADVDIDAEHVCADLNRNGYVQGVFTSDTDTLTYGARTIYRDKSSEFEMITLKECLTKHNLTYNRFIIVCIALGCDFCDKVAGIGPAKVIKASSSIELTPDQLLAFNRFKSIPEYDDPVDIDRLSDEEILLARNNLLDVHY